MTAPWHWRIRFASWNIGRMRLRRSVLSLALVSLVPACGGASAAAGSYEIDKPAFRASLESVMPPEAKSQPEMLNKMLEGVQGTMELRADGTASFAFQMPPMVDQKATGTWKQEGSTLTLTTKDDKGKEDTAKAQWADGRIKMEVDQGGQKFQMVYKRK